MEDCARRGTFRPSSHRKGDHFFRSKFLSYRGGARGRASGSTAFCPTKPPMPRKRLVVARLSLLMGGQPWRFTSQNACRLTTNARQPGVRNGKPSPPALRRTDPARHPRDLTTIEGKGYSSLRTSSRVFACAANCFTVSMYAKFFGRHFGSGDPVRYLLEGDVARIVRTPMIWFFVDAER